MSQMSDATQLAYVWPVEPWPRENARGAPHWRLGVHTFGPAGHSPVVLGMAHRALQEVARLAPQRKRADLPFPTAADQPTFQHDLALLDAQWHAVRAWFREVMEQAEAEVADHGGPLTGVLAAQAKQAARLAHDVAIRCADFAYVWAGSAALRKGNVIGRVFRNVHAAAQHVVLDRQILVSAGPVVGMRLRSGLERSW
jgi:indole-3-acetate monooxygenase